MANFDPLNPPEATNGQNNQAQQAIEITARKRFALMASEISLKFSWILILTVGVLVTLTSYLAGCRGVELLIRSGSTILITSLLCWFLSYMITHGSMEVLKDIQKEEAQITQGIVKPFSRQMDDTMEEIVTEE